MDFKIEENDNIKVELYKDGKSEAKATCYFSKTPCIDGKNIGTIGDFEANNLENGVTILNKCEEILKSKGVKLIVSPMNGNTWKKYRCLKYSDNSPMFALENVNSYEYNQMLIDAGFKEIDTYTSTKGLVADCYNDKSLDVLEEKLKNDGIIIRNFCKEKYIEDLKKIYNISIKSFFKNPFYTSIEEEDFIKQYTQYIDLIKEEFILIAEKDGKEIGFIFCFPDFNQMQRNEKLSTMIVKTVAVIPGFEKYAIGNIMLRMIAKKSEVYGFKDWIFAFMYSNNTSQKMAKRNKTKVIREYALYGKDV